MIQQLHLTKEMHTHVQQVTFTRTFIAVLFTTVKNWKQLKHSPTVEWINILRNIQTVENCKPIKINYCYMVEFHK